MSTNTNQTGSGTGDDITLQQLRCEYKTDPLGIGVRRPRLSWVLASTRRGVAQSAYQIRVVDEQGELWDSGKVSSGQSIHVPYGGSALRSGQRCTWQVRIWDEMGRPSDWSEPAHWEMGLLQVGDWQADWITPDWDEDLTQSQPPRCCVAPLDLKAR